MVYFILLFEIILSHVKLNIFIKRVIFYSHLQPDIYVVMIKSLQCLFKTTMQNHIGLGVNRFASSRIWISDFQIHEPICHVHTHITVYLTL
jgi:hypothetical protein